MSAHVGVELLSAFLDEEIAGEERLHVARHLSGCAACTTRLEELRAIALGLSELARPAVPRALDLVVPARGRLRGPSRARLELHAVSGALSLPFAIVAALAIMLFAVHASRVGRDAQRPVPEAPESAGSESQQMRLDGVVLRYAEGAWRPAVAGEPPVAPRAATAADWARLREELPDLAALAESQPLELPLGPSWIHFEPPEPAPAALDQAER